MEVDLGLGGIVSCSEDWSHTDRVVEEPVSFRSIGDVYVDSLNEKLFTREGVIQLLQSLPRCYGPSDYCEDWLYDVNGNCVRWADIEQLIQKVREA